MSDKAWSGKTSQEGVSILILFRNVTETRKVKVTEFLSIERCSLESFHLLKYYPS